ncbi:uncharacterized protein MONBRDRAFT_30176 [Monosiga brevicollis MX1]|uniref:Protein kinase domain-containing protein n=1 Tax=Monosiga brevicollis TaxID=81824 RepID=A9VD80_MONBE|nr:uncharacterized protein MONBRDRAFT_30176 [Monosiga brevicollis MX1]EDQ84483.1 predicted protein [Monosiga brevicollis MX1]|eukprot:XP_001750670.1 hypothetical protein [Monosiga brevicollis MX1]
MPTPAQSLVALVAAVFLAPTLRVTALQGTCRFPLTLECDDVLSVDVCVIAASTADCYLGPNTTVHQALCDLACEVSTLTLHNLRNFSMDGEEELNTDWGRIGRTLDVFVVSAFEANVYNYNFDSLLGLDNPITDLTFNSLGSRRFDPVEVFEFGQPRHSSVQSLHLRNLFLNEFIMDVAATFFGKLQFLWLEDPVTNLSMSDQHVYLGPVKHVRLDARNYAPTNYPRLARIQTLRSLDMHGYNISTIACDFLPATLNLNVLNISGNNITHFGLDLLHLSLNMFNIYRGLTVPLPNGETYTAAIDMSDNPSTCLLHPVSNPQSSSGPLFINCSCSDPPLREAPYCPPPVFLPCNDSDPSAGSVQQHQVCDGSLDCPNGRDEARCAITAANFHLQPSMDCSGLFTLSALTAHNICGRSCYQNMTLHLRGGVLTWSHNPSNCTDPNNPGPFLCPPLQAVIQNWTSFEGRVGEASLHVRVDEENAALAMELIYHIRFNDNETSLSQEGFFCFLGFFAENRSTNRPFPYGPHLPSVFYSRDLAPGLVTEPASTTPPRLSSSASHGPNTIVIAIVAAIALVALVLILLIHAHLRRKPRRHISITHLQSAREEGMARFEHDFARAFDDRLALAEAFEDEASVQSPAQLKQRVQIGTGRFGPCFMAQASLKTERQAPVMALSLDPGASPALAVEYFAMCRLHHLVARRHPSVLQFYGLAANARECFCVLEYAEGGPLRDYLRSPAWTMQPADIQQQRALIMLTQVAAAMAHLESMSIVHRCLSTDTVYIKRSYLEVRVAGFSMARDVYESQSYVSMASKTVGVEPKLRTHNAWMAQPTEPMTESYDVRFLSPQALIDGEYTIKGDVYAFGCLAYEVITGKQLFRNLNKSAFVAKLRSQPYLDTTGVEPGVLADLIRNCTRTQEKLRPRFVSIFGLCWQKQHNPLLSLSMDARSSLQHADNAVGEVKDLISRFTLQHTIASSPGWRFGLGQAWIVGNSRQARPALLAAYASGWTDVQALVAFLATTSHRTLACPAAAGPVEQEFVLLFPPAKALHHCTDLLASQSLALEVCALAVSALACLARGCFGCNSLPLACLIVQAQDATNASSASATPSVFIQGFPVHRHATRAAVTNLNTALQLTCDLEAAAPTPASREALLKIRSLVQEAVTTSANSADDGTAFDRLMELEARLLHESGLLTKPEYQWSQLRFVQELGQGAFGDVSLMELESQQPLEQERRGMVRGSIGDAKPRQLVAVKTFRDCGNMLQSFQQEVRAIEHLAHPNIVRLLGVVREAHNPAILLEYLPLGSLDGWLMSEDAAAASGRDLLYIAHQVAAGMDELSRLHILHRDLAARNILLGEGLQAKVADFGLSRRVKLYYRMKTARPLPLRWMAPEMIDELKATVKTDVYSYGILLSEIFSYGEEPFGHLGDEEVLALLSSTCRALRQGTRFTGSLLDPPSGMGQALKALFMRCAAVEARSRPTFREIFLETMPHHWATLSRGVRVRKISSNSASSDVAQFQLDRRFRRSISSSDSTTCDSPGGHLASSTHTVAIDLSDDAYAETHI